ncbi:MAG TPA: septum formation initiator family protein [Candidatus Saccharimonadales bacterium]|nr:septum formation initiator family protein [Candidatus Saccharimonadales bacterium]
MGLLACVVAFHVLFGANGLVVYEQKRSESRQLRDQVESFTRQNEHLSQRIKSLKSDPQAIEREAREQLKYVRPGEMVYTLPSPPEDANRTSRR